MDTWDDYTEPTEDERSARRIVALAVTLINARQPLSTERIRSEFYTELGYEAFRKAFLRDRKRLATTGITVMREDLPTGQVGWTVDATSSYAEEGAISSEDALVLDCLLTPLASDPTFPYARDLHIALTKIDHSFSGSVVNPFPHEARKRNRQLERIEACLSLSCAIQIDYERSDGSTTTRVVAPLGLFPLRDTTYLVASRIADGNLEDPHVYNLDRMISVSEIRGTSFTPPENFDIRDYVRLPFELGESLYEATFHVPQMREADVREHVGMRGAWSSDGSASYISVSVADEDMAAAWALAEGVTPKQPQSLVSAWRERIMAFLEMTINESA